MTRFGLRSRLTLACLALLALPAAAHGQGTIRFVGSSGSNANPCTQAQPCRSIQRALNVAPANSTIVILDSANYTGIVINKSVTISAEGVTATILANASGQKAITINNPGARVVLEGLLITGGGTGDTGINIVQAAAVHIEDCQIERFAQNGILINPSQASVFVSDTVASNNLVGLFAFGTDGATPSLTVDNSRFENNSVYGLGIAGGVYANVTWTTAVGNGRGYQLTSASQMTIEYSVARGNNTGVEALATTLARMSNSVVTNNTLGFFVADTAIVETRGNNTVGGNSTDGGPLTLVSGR